MRDLTPIEMQSIADAAKAMSKEKEQLSIFLQNIPVEAMLEEIGNRYNTLNEKLNNINNIIGI